VLAGADDVGVGVGLTRQEQADKTRDGELPQFETKVGRAAVLLEAVYVGQKVLICEDSRINCRKQLSWLQFGAITDGVAAVNVVGVVLLVFW
jgi:hypothetical protein